MTRGRPTLGMLAPAIPMVIAVALTACAAPAATPSGPTLVQVTCEEFEAAGPNGTVRRSLETGVGATFEVILCSNPSTGFSWADPSSEGDAGIQPLGRRSAQPADAPPGTAGRETFSFAATGPGSEAMRFLYSQPWDGGTKGAWTLDLAVDVR